MRCGMIPGGIWADRRRWVGYNMVSIFLAARLLRVNMYAVCCLQTNAFHHGVLHCAVLRYPGCPSMFLAVSVLAEYDEEALAARR